ncbi:unnamed protein product [Ectocarpus sp. 13 AM-2016]
MIAAGTLRRSHSEWASPVVCVMKKNGSVRVTANLKRLNDATVVPCSLLPNVSECIDQLGGSALFSVVDLVSVFFKHQFTKILSAHSHRLKHGAVRACACAHGGERSAEPFSAPDDQSV